MTILNAYNALKALNQVDSPEISKKQNEIGATGKNYSVFTTDENNKATKYFSPENLGINLAGNLQDYVKKNGNFENLQQINLAPKLTSEQSGNGFALGSDSADYTINATTRYLTTPENKEALAKMCELYGIKDPDYKKLQEAMIKSNKNNDLVISKDEIDAYKKSQMEINGQESCPKLSKSNNNQQSTILNILQTVLSFFFNQNQPAEQNNQQETNGQNAPF